jgi:hypothetical protein
MHTEHDQQMTTAPAVTPSADVEASDFEQAILILVRALAEEPKPGYLATDWLERTLKQLFVKADRYFTGGPRMETQQQAKAVLDRAANELKVAAHHLEDCASRLKSTGAASAANVAYRASLRAKAAAEEFSPDA